MVTPVRAGGFSGTEVARFFATLGMDASGFNRGMASAQATATGFNRVLVGAGGLVGGIIAATAAIKGIETVIFGSMRGVIDYETAFVGLQKTVIATDEEFAAIDANIRDLATDIPVARTELARIGQIAGQLGIRGVSDLNEFIDTIARMGVATDLTSESAAVSLARLSAIFHRPIEDVESLASAIVFLGNTEAAFEQEIIDIAARIGPSAEIVGLSEQFVLGLSATLPAVGLRPELAGTALQRALLQIQTLVVEGGEELDLLAALAGSSSEEFAKLWVENTDQAFAAFLEGINQLEEIAPLVLDELSLSQQRTLRTLLAIAENLPRLEKNIQNARLELEQMKFPELERESERVFGTTASNIAIFQNNVRELADAIGGPLVEALIDVLPPLTEFVQLLTGNLPPGEDITLGGRIDRAGAQGQLDSTRGRDTGITTGISLGVGTAMRFIAGAGAGAIGGLAALAGLIPDRPTIQDPTIFEETFEQLRNAQVEAFSDTQAFETIGGLLAEGILESFTDEMNRTRIRFATPEAQLEFGRRFGLIGPPDTGFQAHFGPPGPPVPLVGGVIGDEISEFFGDLEDLTAGMIIAGTAAGDTSDEMNEFQRQMLALLRELFGAEDELDKEAERLKRLQESLEQNRMRQLVQAFAEGDEAEIARLERVFAGVDAELAKLAPMLMERFGVLPVEVAGIFDAVRSEIEQGADNVLNSTDVLGFLLARRLGLGDDVNSLFARDDRQPLTIENTFGSIVINGEMATSEVVEAVAQGVTDATKNTMASV